jgi:hypothetical protein
MSGQRARSGFQFQDLYLLLQVLKAVRDALGQAWINSAPDILPLIEELPFQFGVEANTRRLELTRREGSEGTRDWDVLIESQEDLKLVEVKSGAIGKDDRIAFWLRIRRELAQPRTKKPLVPGLVVDPRRNSTLAIWEGLPMAVHNYSGGVLSDCPIRVSSADHLLREAVFWLCTSGQDLAAGIEACELDRAKDAIGRFQLDQWESEKLDNTVSSFLLALFPDGITDTIHRQVSAWINDRAMHPDPDIHFFSARQMMAEIGLLEQTLRAKPGQISRWRNLWNDLSALMNDRVRPSLGIAGATVPKEQSQPAAIFTIKALQQNAVVVGAAGIGKSALMAQIAEERRANKSPVLWCGLNDLGQREFEDFEDSVRFQTTLSSLSDSDQNILLLADGLDDLDRLDREVLVQCLKRMGQIPQLRIIVTVRDAIWNRDAKLRSELGEWTHLSLKEWDVEIVRSTLATTAVANRVSGNLERLLRTPILLDIFWRTFVETEAIALEKIDQIQTRHGLLSAFWRERILGSRQHHQITNQLHLLTPIWEIGAATLGPFPEHRLPMEAVEALLSEGVLVKERVLQPRLQFRHPLFRDFAFAQWCLSLSSAQSVVDRWSGIIGDLKRWGCLRALLEALTEPDSAAEFPEVDARGLIVAVLSHGEEPSHLLASTLGSLFPSNLLDPALWSPNIELPTWFGSELLLSARLNANAQWAGYVTAWPEDSNWCDEYYPEELLRYAERLCHWATADRSLAQIAILIGRKLRRLSEIPRFHKRFDNNGGWLKGQIIAIIIRLDTSDETLAWLERQISDAPWRVRLTILDALPLLARAKPERAAALYRRALSLLIEDGRPRLDRDKWLGVLKFQAIDLVLAGADGRPAILCKYPTAFLPAALDLAEALSISYLEELNRKSAEIGKRMAEFFRSLDRSAEETENDTHLPDIQDSLAGKDPLEDLIDDKPDELWKFGTGGDYHDTLSAIRTCLEQVSESESEIFVSQIAPILRNSRLATVHSFLLQIAFERRDNTAFQDLLRDSLLDSRLYHVPGLMYWIESAIGAVWQSSDFETRQNIIRNIAKTTTSPHYSNNFACAQFLAQIPFSDLSPEQRSIVEEHQAKGFKPTAAPVCDRVIAQFVEPDMDEEIRAHTADWPTGIDLALLTEFYRKAIEISQIDAVDNRLRHILFDGIRCAEPLVQQLSGKQATFVDPLHQWFLQALVDTFRKIDSLSAAGVPDTSPPSTFVRACTELSVTLLEDKSVLEDALAKIKNDPAGRGTIVIPTVSWVTALSLADAAFAQVAVSEDKDLQDRFEALIATGFRQSPPNIQQLITIRIRPWHWLRNPQRRRLHDQLFWREASNAAVIASSLSRIEYYSGSHQAAILRELLQREDIEHPRELTESLGQILGALSIAIDSQGNRLPAAHVARELLEDNAEFPLLIKKEVRCEFLRWFVFGMKNAAPLAATRREPARDFSTWIYLSWLELHRLEPLPENCQHTMVFVCYWLGKAERKAGQTLEVLTYWWQCIFQNLLKIIKQGTTRDLNHIFTELKSGRFKDLTTVNEVFALVYELLERVEETRPPKTLNLDLTRPELGQHIPLRDVLEDAVETLDSLRKDGLLVQDTQKQQAYRLLARLANEPIGSGNARSALHMLESE